MNREEQNEALRERIIDLADLWDGAESSRYGEALIDILDELEIFDTPQFYSKENIKQLLDEIQKDRKKK